MINLNQVALILTLTFTLACSVDDTAVEAEAAEPAVVTGVPSGIVQQPTSGGDISAIPAELEDNEVARENEAINEDVSTVEGPRNENVVNEETPKVYDEGCPAGKTEWDMTPPVFKHIGIDLAPVDHATGWAGSFNFNDRTALGGSIHFFEPFGYQPPWEGYAPISDWIFGTAPGTNVYSPLDGIVVHVAKNTNWDDWELVINPRNCSKSFYFVTVDHIVDVTVAIGDRVVAGQVIGKKGADHNNGQYEGNARTFEITVGNANGEAFCPLIFFPPAERADAIAKLEQLVLDIETYVSPDPNITFNYLGNKFDESAWAGDNLVGCYAEMNGFSSVPYAE